MFVLDESIYTKPLRIKFKKLSDDAVIPEYAKPFDSGFDLRSIDERILYPGQFCGVRTGLSIELPNPKETFPFVLELQIRPRSGLAINEGVTVLNTPGTIDNQYRGELVVIIINHNHDGEEEYYHIKKGDKIAQGVIVPILASNMIYSVETDELNKTIRGSDGFGSTGIN